MFSEWRLHKQGPAAWDRGSELEKEDEDREKKVENAVKMLN